jgi:hypothetical protein
VESTLPTLRHRLLLRYRRGITREACHFMRSTYGPLWWQQRASSLLRRPKPLTGGSPSQDDQDSTPNLNSHTMDELNLDLDRIQVLIHQIARSTWWDWEGGSSLIFWQWGSAQKLAQEGMSPYVVDTFPSTCRPTRKPKREKY